MTLTLRRATVADADALAPLFDGYRQFYRHPSDLERARTFLAERLARDEAIVFMVEDDDRRRGSPCSIRPSPRPRRVRSWC